MSVALSGFRANSADNLVLGPGVIFLNYGETTGERILGMTNSGNTFSTGVTYRDIESDRQFGMLKGLRVIDEINPTITSNLMEIDVANLKAAIPGLVEVPFTPAEITADANLADYTRLRIGALDDTHYFKNVALVATVLGSNLPVICMIKNAVSNGEIEISLENKSEATVEVTFTGMFDGAGLEDLANGTKSLEDIAPFEIRYPTATP